MKPIAESMYSVSRVLSFSGEWVPIEKVGRGGGTEGEPLRDGVDSRFRNDLGGDGVVGGGFEQRGYNVSSFFRCSLTPVDGVSTNLVFLIPAGAITWLDFLLHIACLAGLFLIKDLPLIGRSCDIPIAAATAELLSESNRVSLPSSKLIFSRSERDSDKASMSFNFKARSAADARASARSRQTCRLLICTLNFLICVSSQGVSFPVRWATARSAAFLLVSAASLSRNFNSRCL